MDIIFDTRKGGFIWGDLVQDQKNDLVVVWVGKILEKFKHFTLFQVKSIEISNVIFSKSQRELWIWLYTFIESSTFFLSIFNWNIVFFLNKKISSWKIKLDFSISNFMLVFIFETIKKSAPTCYTLMVLSKQNNFWLAQQKIEIFFRLVSAVVLVQFLINWIVCTLKSIFCRLVAIMKWITS